MSCSIDKPGMKSKNSDRNQQIHRYQSENYGPSDRVKTTKIIKHYLLAAVDHSYITKLERNYFPE